MRVLLAPVTAAAVLLSSMGAFAAATVTNGTVKAFSPTAMTLTLNDGTVYALPKNFKDPGVKVGEKVKISWTKQQSKNVADAVTIVK